MYVGVEGGCFVSSGSGGVDLESTRQDRSAQISEGHRDEGNIGVKETGMNVSQGNGRTFQVFGQDYCRVDFSLVDRLRKAQIHGCNHRVR